MPQKLSLTGKRWIVKQHDIADSAVAFMRSLFHERNLLGSARDNILSDPFLFAEMGRAVERIRAAVDAGETIAIFGDYDADGITGTAQLVRFFRRRGIEPITYLPHRVKEGYGLKNASIDALKQKGVSLIITVDTGIAAHAECAYAQTLGIDVIVTDHHHPVTVVSPDGPTNRPPAHAVIHPLVPSAFPNLHLCGSGVAFMLVRALEPERSWKGIEEDFVLATIGTVADLVPLTGENRTLVTWGLSFLESLPPGPLRDVVNTIRQRDHAITSTDIAFRLAPRINASGRVNDPSIALSAILDGGDAIGQLERFNAERQRLTTHMYAIAETMVDRDAWLLCLGSDTFSAGLAGLIAGRLTEAYGRPSLVAAFDGNRAIASLRSIPSYDIMHALRHAAVAPLLQTCGGHRQAAGCTFDVRNFEQLKEALKAAMHSSGLEPELLLPTLTIDAVLKPADLSLDLWQAISALEPFGQENKEPLFSLTMQTLEGIRCVGEDGKHMQCRIAGKKAVGFSLGKYADALMSEPVDIAFHIAKDTWNGRHDVQIVINDIRLSRSTD